MGLHLMRAAVCVTVGVLVGGSCALGAGAALAATAVDDPVAPAPMASPTGSYIVLLEGAPAATYDGGVPGLLPTAPAAGETFDPHSPEVRSYADHLRSRQEQVAADAEVEPSATYQVVLNGFSAKMTPDAAARVAAADGVLAVHPDEILRPDAAPAAPAGGATIGGLQEQLARADTDGAGVVVGVIDTGIAPANPSFAGERLRAVRTGAPYLSGNVVVFDKPDGRQFRSARVTGEGWAKGDYSTKIVGAQYFGTGAEAAGFGFTHDALSPVDRDGHGSRAAGVAAGESGVDAMIEGVDLGVISGVAPAAKIASYKACFVGPDPAVATDDVCVGSDLLAALDRAVADGVDVVNYSVGGGAAASGWTVDDLAFYNAAVAGVFIAVSAGNTGPGASTVQGGAPWYTTVAAATVRGFEGTVQLSTGFAAPGVSVTVRPGEEVTAPVVYAGDAALAGAADAHLCYPGTLDPTAVEGRIVVCDRGTNPRIEKSQEVREAGGVGMILVNATPDSLDADFHAVPTVHIDAGSREELLAGLASGPDATATLSGENTREEAIPAPQIAGFSGRGPLAGVGDVLAPDVAAPGVAILAATRDDSDGDPAWAIASGTSLAAPHVSGLAALYLAEQPAATPDEIKSALMTTAFHTVGPDGSADLDPFGQGAGHVDATRVRDPGLLYLNGPAQWADHLASGAAGTSTDADLAGTDMNLPSIAVPALAQDVTVIRTVTATRAGAYDVAADIPGVEVTVSPSTLTFSGSGDVQEFTVTFANSTAPVEEWATGWLTWTGQDGTSVRSPLAVRPVSADAPALVTGEGLHGTAEVVFVPGVSGRLALDTGGLAPIELLVDPDEPAPGHSGDATSGDENGDIGWVVDVPAGSPLARFELEGSAGDDLDLAVYRVTDPDDPRYEERWLSATGDAREQIALVDPAPGSYLVVANVRAASEGTTWDLTSAIVPGEGSLAAEPASLTTVAGSEARYTLSWADLRPDTRYLGVVGYGGSGIRTVVEVGAGAAPATTEAVPVITGTAEVGGLLRVDPGEWSSPDVVFAYQWLRDGEPISGATWYDYRIRDADVGSTLSAEVIATERGNVNPGTAVSEEVVVDIASRVQVTVDRSRAGTTPQYAVTVEVSTAAGEPAAGSVTVTVDAAEYTGTLADGRVTFALPTPSRGAHTVVAEYAGTVGVADATGRARFVVD